MLNENGEPIDIHSVSLTNTPAFKGFINPVINSEATPIDDTNERITNMTKEELKALIEEILAEKAKEEAIRDVKEEAIEAAIEKAPGVVDVIDACGKEDDKVKNEAVVEDPKEEEKKVEKTKEVIKEEALNSAPTIGEDIAVEPEWKKLHGKAFLDWYKKNGRNCR